MNTETQIWVGQSGNRYEFSIYPLQDYWAKRALYEVPGIYIYAKPTPAQPSRTSIAHLIAPWERPPAYIGKTINLASRVDRHPDENTWACIVDYGATHLHAICVDAETDRDFVEVDLIQFQKPYCNIQHV